jgi:putative acetyltransferase
MQPLIIEIDPNADNALALLRLAAIEARRLYADLQDQNAPWPTNEPTQPRGTYLVAYLDGQPVGMGAHRPLTESVTEVRRMYVQSASRRLGIASALLAALESHAAAQGFAALRLETGNRQAPAMRLYERYGFVRIPAFGPYAADPTSVCYEKPIAPEAAGTAARRSPTKTDSAPSRS